MNNTQLLKVTNEVFENRDQKAKGVNMFLLIAATGKSGLEQQTIAPR